MAVDMVSDAEIGPVGAIRVSVLRFLRFLLWMTILVGPIAVGGSLGWWLTTEVGRDVELNALLRNQSASIDTAAPLVSRREIEAAGLSIEDTQVIVDR